MTNNLDQILLERSCRYGNFQDVAQRTNNIFAAMLNHAPQLPHTSPLYREALHMIAYKLARLVNGRIDDLDSWHDIAGYALLVHGQIAAEQEAKADKATKPVSSPFSDKAVLDAMEEAIAKDLSAGEAT